MRLAELTSRLVEFCYPRTCAACRQAIDDSGALCDDCNTELARLQAHPFCDQCGMPSAEPDAPCAYCLGKGVPHFDRIVRLGTFHDPLKHLIHQMKYHRRWQIAELLAQRLASHEPARKLLADADVLVPVPLHPIRQISRGYNQAEVIARMIGSAFRRRVAQPLARVKRTPMQPTMTSQAKRAENMRSAFLLEDDKLVRGKRVVLIDDVLTTGATLQSAARTIADAKPASTSALVVAVADPKQRDFQVI